MSDLKGPPAELRFTVHIKRAATGQVETYQLVGRVGDTQPAQQPPHPQPTVKDRS